MYKNKIKPKNKKVPTTPDYVFSHLTKEGRRGKWKTEIRGNKKNKKSPMAIYSLAKLIDLKKLKQNYFYSRLGSMFFQRNKFFNQLTQDVIQS